MVVTDIIGMYNVLLAYVYVPCHRNFVCLALFGSVLAHLIGRVAVNSSVSAPQPHQNLPCALRLPRRVRMAALPPQGRLKRNAGFHGSWRGEHERRVMICLYSFLYTNQFARNHGTNYGGGAVGAVGGEDRGPTAKFSPKRCCCIRVPRGDNLMQVLE